MVCELDLIMFTVSRLSMSFAVSIMYGYQVKYVDDPVIVAADRSLFLAGGLLTPDKSIINLFPFLAHIPPWLSGPMTSLKVAAEARGLLKYMQDSMLNFAKTSVVCLRFIFCH